MLAFAIGALIVGAVIVYVLPRVKGAIDALPSPGLARLTSNSLVHLLIIGAIVMLALGVVVGIARRFRIPVKV